MDFAGKSTLTRSVSPLLAVPHTLRHRFISQIDPIQELIDHRVWIPRHDFVPLLVEMVLQDLGQVDPAEWVLQDSLWFLKFVARLTHEEPNCYGLEVDAILAATAQLNPSGSFYLSASRRDRLARFRRRSLRPSTLSNSDRLISRWQDFAAIDAVYLDLITHCFPGTEILDTSSEAPSALAAHIVKQLESRTTLTEL